MPDFEDVSLGTLPDELLESIVRVLADFTVGFVRVDETPAGQDVILLGSGTLVSAGKTRGILTAEHVVRVLPAKGRIGLILASTPQIHTIDATALQRLWADRGAVDAEGPDIAVLALPDVVAGTIAAKKTFYNLDLRRELMLQNPDIRDGFWNINGFVDELTRVDRRADGTIEAKGFCNFAGAGGPEADFTIGNYDYVEFPVIPVHGPGVPTSFGGVSGGGLWQIPLLRDAAGRVDRKGTPLLSGVVFYQFEQGGHRHVKCHFRRSVYKEAYDRLATVRSAS